MANVFTANEIVGISIQIEKNGRDFYNALTERYKDKDAVDLFKYLAGEEEKHIQTFQKILDSVGKHEPQETYPGEYLEYMNALAAESVFTEKAKGKEAASGAKNSTDAVNMGIGFEKDSIIFYQSMKKVVPEHDYKTLNDIISEERSHLRKLYNLKKKLGGES